MAKILLVLIAPFASLLGMNVFLFNRWISSKIRPAMSILSCLSSPSQYIFLHSVYSKFPPSPYLLLRVVFCNSRTTLLFRRVSAITGFNPGNASLFDVTPAFAFSDSPVGSLLHSLVCDSGPSRLSSSASFMLFSLLYSDLLLSSYLIPQLFFFFPIFVFFPFFFDQ